LKRLEKGITVALAFVSVITLIGGGVTTTTMIPLAYAHNHNNGKGWPKSVIIYQPENAEGLTGLTIGQCDRVEQYKEVMLTPSLNKALKESCEEFNSEKCKKLKEFPEE
jgi:hypothetical protein